MKIILEDMDGNTIKTIKKVNHDNLFNYSSKVKKIEYDDNFQLFDMLNENLIVLSPSKTSSDFIIEFISKNYIDYINGNSLDLRSSKEESLFTENKPAIDFTYQKIVGRYFFESFPFISAKKLKKIFFDVYKSGESYEFRELKYIDDILVSIYRHKIFLSDEKLFHTGHYENDLEMLYYAGEDFFYKSERPYIVIDGNSILKVNDTFLDVFNIEKDEILGECDFSVLNLIDSDFNQLETRFNNLLNRKSFYEIFEFSIDDFRSLNSSNGLSKDSNKQSKDSNKQSKDSNKQSKDSNSLKKETDNSINHYHDEKHVLRAYASPSIYDSSPAIKIFFKNIKEEIKYKKESQYLRDTLSLVQNKNSLAVLFKSDSKRDENSVYEESLLNDRMERMDSFRFDEGHDDESFTDMLSRKTTYSSGIYNILYLDSRFHRLDDIDIMEYIIDADRQNVVDDLESLSKNYNPIDVNFRIKSSRNKEKYLGLIIEGQFDENGSLKNYMGFIKDNSSRFYYEKELKDSLRDMDALLNEVLDINSKLIAMSNSEEQLQENSYSFIMDLLDLFIKIMDSKLEKGCLKKDILQDIQLIINVLLLIHRHIGFSRENNFNLLNMSLKDYIEELLPYLYSHSYLNLKYVLDLEDFKVDIGTMAYLGIMIYEFLFNVLSYDIMEKKYTNVSITLRREKNNGILRIRNEYGDLDNPNRKDLNIISYITGSLDFELIKEGCEEDYTITFPISNDFIISLK